MTARCQELEAAWHLLAPVAIPKKPLGAALADSPSAIAEGARLADARVVLLVQREKRTRPTQGIESILR